jgi:subtilase family serine protease
MTVNAGAPPPAQLAVTVTADPGGTIPESDESNNTKTETTTISGTVCTGTPCVDLFAVAIGTPPISPPFGLVTYTATVANGGDATVLDSTPWSVDLTLLGPGLIVSVTPAGSGVTCLPSIPLGWRCTNASGGSADAMDLGPGASITFTVLATAGPPSSFMTFNVTADPTNQVPELPALNNTAVVVTGTTPPPGP